MKKIYISTRSIEMKRVANHIMAIITILVLLSACGNEKAEHVYQGDEFSFTLELVTDSVQIPYAMAFISKTEILVSDRFVNKMYRVNVKTGKRNLVKGVPSSYTAGGDGGALDIVPHTDFHENRLIYFSHAIGDTTKSTLVVDRAKLISDSLVQMERILSVFPFYKGSSHYGNRMVLQDGYLYVTMGDRYDLMDSAQYLSNHLGKVLRIHEDGRVPKDNPFTDQKGALPEIWSYGHRNPQGLTVHPETGTLWEHEHGPKGGDEINIIEPGKNYGWPVITHGIDYDDTPIGNGITHQKGMEQPLHYYVPSIAPSGMLFYQGKKYPNWNGNLFIGAMAKTHLNRLVIKDNRVVHEERLLKEFGRRIRSIQQGPAGYLYIGVDGGAIYRLITQ